MTPRWRSTLVGRFVHGLGAQGLAQGVQFLVRFAEVSLLLAFWGKQLYGEWLMIVAIPSYLSMADGGFVSTAGRDMAIRAGAGQREQSQATFRSTWILIVLLSLGLGSLLGLGAWFLPSYNWLHFAQIHGDTLRWVLVLLVVYMLAGFQLGLVNGGFWCEGAYPVGISLSAGAQLLEFFGLAIAVVNHGGPISAALGLLVGRTCGFLVMRLALYRVTPWLRYGWKGASLSEIRRLLGPSLASLAFPLGTALNIQGLRLTVGLVLGPPAVAVFVPLRTLSRLALQGSTAAVRVVEPEMALAYGGNKARLVQTLFRRGSQLALWSAFAGCVLLLIFGGRFISIWTHGQVPMNWSLFGLLLATAVVNAVWHAPLMVAYATNRHQRVALYYALLYGICAVAMAYAGGHYMGFFGIGLALLIAEIMVGAYVLKTALTLVGDSWRMWVAAMRAPPWALVRSLKEGSWRE